MSFTIEPEVSFGNMLPGILAIVGMQGQSRQRPFYDFPQVQLQAGKKPQEIIIESQIFPVFEQKSGTLK